jgi:ubiquinone/menaquinone biosynthesis C-methylase UbiE
MMLDLAEVRTGSRVLDVAAGTGDQTIMAAQRVGPTGFVLGTDISASMLNLAADLARETGLTNVETRLMDAENIDLDADSFDAVICQLGLMVFSNPVKVLRAMRRVLRQGGKVAALVFSTAAARALGVKLQVLSAQDPITIDNRVFGGDEGARLSAHCDTARARFSERGTYYQARGEESPADTLPRGRIQ